MSDERPENLVVPGKHSVTYGSYLKIHELLRLQTPLSVPAEHDETLFIVVHQAYELWFKQLLHEAKKAIHALELDQLMLFNRTLRRMTTIQSVLTHQVDVLETMTPSDFNLFRDNLNPASGFQSHQFRELEFRLGAKDPAYLKFHKLDHLASEALAKAMAEPSLWDRFLEVLVRRGFTLGQSARRDPQTPYSPSEDVLKAIVAIYRESELHYSLYSTLEALIDLDEGLLLWRQRHVAMVERMIGNRRGTGGSSGVKYLSSTLAKRCFPEIWEARNWLGAGKANYGDGKDS